MSRKALNPNTKKDPLTTAMKWMMDKKQKKTKTPTIIENINNDYVRKPLNKI